jgi:hypothetical protein
MRCGVTALGSSSLRSECRYGLSRHTAFASGTLQEGFIAELKAVTLTALSWRENAKQTKPLLTGRGPAIRSDILSKAKRSLGLWGLAPSTVKEGESCPNSRSIESRAVKT